MTSKYPRPTQITAQGEQLLNILLAEQDWLGRRELAQRMNKTSLNKWDIGLLQKLEDEGKLESRKIPHHSPIGFEWEYRAITGS